MSLDRRRVHRVVALLGALGAYVTIVLGGTVRGVGAGLACPDWPLCHGSLIPNLADQAIAIEYAHRLAAAFTSACLLLTFAFAVLWFRPHTRLVVLSLTTLAILATQVVIGALTITSGLDWVIVTTHLALGTATFASALTVAIVAWWSPGPRIPGQPMAELRLLHDKVDDAHPNEPNRDPRHPVSGPSEGGRRQEPSEDE